MLPYINIAVRKVFTVMANTPLVDSLVHSESNTHVSLFALMTFNPTLTTDLVVV
jgi:hypothetical protein